MHPDLSIGAGGTATFNFQQRPGRSPLKARESQAVVRDYLRDVGRLAAACGLRMPALADLGLDLASNEAEG
jgi:hypothetical protein